MNVSHDITKDLGQVLADYKLYSGKSDEEILQKQGGKLGYEIFKALREIAHEKGFIRREIMGRIKAKKFIKIRPSVKEEVEREASQSGGTFQLTPSQLRAAGGVKVATGENKFLKRDGKVAFFGSGGRELNRTVSAQQEAVRREIAIRESGSRVLSVSSRYPRVVVSGQMALNRRGTPFSNVMISLGGQPKYLRFEWPGDNELSENVAKGLQSKKGKAAVQVAIERTRQDIADYVMKKQLEVTKKAVRALRKS